MRLVAIETEDGAVMVNPYSVEYVRDDDGTIVIQLRSGPLKSSRPLADVMRKINQALG